MRPEEERDRAKEELWKLMRAIADLHEVMQFTPEQRAQTWRACLGKMDELMQVIHPREPQ